MVVSLISSNTTDKLTAKTHTHTYVCGGFANMNNDVEVAFETHMAHTYRPNVIAIWFNWIVFVSITFNSMCECLCSLQSFWIEHCTQVNNSYIISEFQMLHKVYTGTY